jgi:hypothetical protein
VVAKDQEAAAQLVKAGDDYLRCAEVSAFTHTFKRWTGKAPSQMRTTAAF